MIVERSRADADKAGALQQELGNLSRLAVDKVGAACNAPCCMRAPN